MFTNSAISRKHCYQNSIDTVNSPPPKTLLLEQQRIPTNSPMNSNTSYEQYSLIRTVITCVQQRNPLHNSSYPSTNSTYLLTISAV
jgi:hypothetical protein